MLRMIQNVGLRIVKIGNHLGMGSEHVRTPAYHSPPNLPLIAMVAVFLIFSAAFSCVLCLSRTLTPAPLRLLQARAIALLLFQCLTIRLTLQAPTAYSHVLGLNAYIPRRTPGKLENVAVSRSKELSIARKITIVILYKLQTVS